MYLRLKKKACKWGNFDSSNMQEEISGGSEWEKAGVS